jgi:hypothetical protein
LFTTTSSAAVAGQVVKIDMNFYSRLGINGENLDNTGFITQSSGNLLFDTNTSRQRSLIFASGGDVTRDLQFNNDVAAVHVVASIPGTPGTGFQLFGRVTIIEIRNHVPTQPLEIPA